MESVIIDIVIDHEKKAICRYFKGLIKTDEICESWQQIITMPEFTNLGYNLLTDYAEAEFDFPISKTEDIWKCLDNLKNLLTNRKEAIIAVTPFNTAVNMLFEKDSYRLLNYWVKTFSTREAAIDWLMK